MNTVNKTIAQKDPAAKDVQEGAARAARPVAEKERIVSIGHASATVEPFKQMVGRPEAMKARPTEKRRRVP